MRSNPIHAGIGGGVLGFVGGFVSGTAICALAYAILKMGKEQNVRFAPMVVNYAIPGACLVAMVCGLAAVAMND